MKYTKYILSILIPFLVAYFLGAVYTLSFDLLVWEKETRAFMLAVGSVFSTAFSIVLFSIDLANTK